MKYLKLFEAFESPLTDDQDDDLTEVFFEYVKSKRISSDMAEGYFQPGTDTFVKFLECLSDETEWFDYTQVDAVILALNDLIIEYDRIENEDDEFVDDDLEEETDGEINTLDPEDDTIEHGDFVDFKGHGHLYVVTILGDGYLVSDDPSQRYLGDNGDGFLIPLDTEFNILQKGQGDYGDD